MRILVLFAAFIALALPATSQALQQTKGDFEDKFRQLDEDWPTPNESRLASGAPGPAYWQQDVDYKIKVRLNEAARRLIGFEKVTYTNNSPHTLNYLWLQLDQNRESKRCEFRQDTIAGRLYRCHFLASPDISALWSHPKRFYRPRSLAFQLL